MSRVAYASLGKRGSFSASTRYGSHAPGAAGTVGSQASSDPAADAYRAGYEDGRAAAKAEAEAAIAQERAARAAIELSFVRFDSDSAKSLREGLRVAVHALCEQAVMPLAYDTEAMTKRIEAAAGMLQRRHDERRIHIHPDDLQLVRDHVAPGLELVPDASIERGGLRVETEDGGVEDGPQQWRRALAELFDPCTP